MSKQLKKTHLAVTAALIACGLSLPAVAESPFPNDGLSFTMVQRDAERQQQNERINVAGPASAAFARSPEPAEQSSSADQEGAWKKFVDSIERNSAHTYGD